MSNFTFSPTDIPGVQIVDVKCFGDARGYFMETYRAADFAAAGITDAFVQDNQSCSHRGVLRGLHFQKRHQQAKLVRAISGEIFDVAVDLRRGSATYGRPIVIEDKAWIGINSTILPGVRIGYGAIVGAGSVVTKDVPPMTVVAGNPAKFIKKIETGKGINDKLD